MPEPYEVLSKCRCHLLVLFHLTIVWSPIHGHICSAGKLQAFCLIIANKIMHREKSDRSVFENSLVVRVGNLCVRSAGSQSRTKQCGSYITLVFIIWIVIRQAAIFSLLGLCQISLYFVPLEVIPSSRRLCFCHFPCPLLPLPSLFLIIMDWH